MADTITNVTNQINTDIRNKTANKSVTRDNVSDSLQKLADNQRPDWAETDPNALTYIQNKPTEINTLLRGEVDLGDLGSSITVRGGITSASRTIGDSANAVIQVNFADIGTANYIPKLQIYGLVDNLVSASGLGSCNYLRPTLTSTSFKFSLREFAGEGQNCGVYIELVESF